MLARRLAENPGSTLEDVAAQENMGGPYAARVSRLNYLAPDIVAAILDGKHPVDLTANKLMADPVFRSTGALNALRSDLPDRVRPLQSPWLSKRHGVGAGGHAVRDGRTTKNRL